MAAVPKIKLTLGSTGRGASLEDGAYEYLCRLEEAKQWLEHMLGETLPPVTELEDAFQNGVILCKLGMKLLPDDPAWRKVYDLDLEKFKTRGLDYRYTDNINFWLGSLHKFGLPKVFYPVMTDIYHKKNVPKLIYCLHALSHLLRKKGKASQAVGDLYGSIEFPHEALVQTTHTLKTRTRDMPVFGVVENLVDEELQYQAMGLSDSAEEETRPDSPSDMRRTATPEELEPLFDDPKYWTTKTTTGRKAVTNGTNGSAEAVSRSFATVACDGQGVSVSLYRIKDDEEKKKTASMTPFDGLLGKLNEALADDHPDDTMKILQNPDANFPFVTTEPMKYHRALLRETREGVPGNVLSVFHGIDRDMCDGLLEKMTAGAYIVRSSVTVQGAYVMSFRNHTGIKHWKLSTKHNKFYWGSSSLYSSLEDFIQQFIEALAKATKLRIFQGMTSALRPVFTSPEHQSIMGSLRESHSSLTYGQICKVIKEVNTEVRQGRKSSFSDQHSHTSLKEKQSEWNLSMLVKVNRVEAEKILMKEGKPGSYLVRPSERNIGDYALAFRTGAEMRHWRIVQDNGKFYVHPRPNPYDSLEDIVQHFRDAVGSETSLAMFPLVCSTSTIPVSSGGSRSGEISGMDTLAPWTPTSPLRNSVVVPSQSLSKLNPANLTSWSVDDVCYWLTQQGLGKFIDVFKDNAVDGDCLMMLDNNLLKDDLGITALGHRSRILKRVKTLKESVHPQLQ